MANLIHASACRRAATLFALTLVFAAGSLQVALAQTTISEVSASPTSFYADEAESTTLTAVGTPGVANLAMRVTMTDRSTVVRGSIALAESPAGTYTCVWNGKNDSNQVVAPGNYQFRVYNLATSSYIGPWGSVDVVSRRPNFLGASVSPNPYVPNGTAGNPVSIHISATPLDTGEYTWGIYNNWLGWMVYKAAMPTPTSPGEYDVTWDGVAVHSYTGYMGNSYGGYGEDHSYNQSYVVLWAPDGTQLSSPANSYFKVRGVWDLSRDKSEIEPKSGEYATFTAVGYDGLNLEVRITRNTGGAEVGLFPMTAIGNGQYTFSWNGRDASDVIQPTGDYSLRVRNADSGIPYYGANTSLRLRYTVDSVSVAPDPFSPNGTGDAGQIATVTVNAAAGQTGLKYGLHNNWLGWMQYQQPLSESGTPGVYTVTWDGVSHYSYDGYMGSTYSGYGEDHSYNTCTVYVWDANGQESIVKGSFKVRGVDRLERDKSSFAAGAENVTFTARGYSGFNVRIRVYKSAGTTPVRTAMMTDNGDGTYTFVWDGKSDEGAIQPPGGYTAYIYNADSDRRYYPSESVNLTFTVESITVVPNPYSPDGTGSELATLTIQAAPGLTGLKYGIHNNWLGWMQYRQPLNETATPGVYEVTWDGVGHYSYDGYMGNTYSGYGEDHSYNTCTVYVWDASNVESILKGSFKVRGVDRLDRDKSEFNPRAGGTVTFTGRGYAGFPVRIRIYLNSPSTLIRTGMMTDNGDGTYTYVWDGRNESNELQKPGAYTAYIYNATSDRRYYPSQGVNVQFDTDSVTVDRDPFTPNGTPDDVVTVTVNSDPGQTLTYYINHEWLGTSFSWKALTETSPGVYQGTWDGVQHSSYDGYIPAHTSYRARVYIRNADNVQAETVTYFNVRGAHGVSTDANDFTPGGSNLLNITVPGQTGLQLDAWVYNVATNVVTRHIQLTEASGSYTGAWDGKDDNGNFAGAGTYRIYPYARAGQKPYYYSKDVTVKPAVFSIEASPDPFAPTGANSVTLTLRADPGQAGLYAKIIHPGGQNAQVSLTEQGTEGTYIGTWDGKFGSDLSPAGVCTVKVYTSTNVEFPQTGTLTVASVSNLAATPNPFEPGDGRTVVISADVGSGVSLNLEARISTLKTLPLTDDGSGKYSATWNGEVSSGIFIAAGDHTVYLYNSVTGQRYSPTLTLTIVDNTPPTAFITGGPAAGSTVLGNVTFVWSASDNVTPPASIQFSYRMDAGEWSAYGTEKTHSFTLDNGSHTFAVRAKDQAGNISDPVERTFQVDNNPKGGINVRVTTNGNPAANIEGANVHVTGGPDSVDLNATTNAQGLAAFDQLRVGTYAIEATKAGLETASTTADVASGQVTPVTIALAGGPNIVVNGDFEEPLLGGSWTHYSAGQSIPGWTFAQGGGALIRDYWSPVRGMQSLELNNLNTGRGAVAQSVPAQLGKLYHLRFALAGQPNAGPTVKRTDVWFGGQLIDSPTFDVTGKSLPNMGWVYKDYYVRALSSEVELVFDGVVPATGDGGPAIDDVSLKLVADQQPVAFDPSVSGAGITITPESPIMSGTLGSVGVVVTNYSDMPGTADLLLQATDGVNTLTVGSASGLNLPAWGSATADLEFDTTGLNGTYRIVATVQNPSPADSNVSNNSAKSDNVIVTGVVPIYYGYNPNNTGQLRLVAFSADTHYEIWDLGNTSAPVSTGTLAKAQAASFSLNAIRNFKVDADKPMFVHLGYDCCSFGGSYFYPALDGADRVGTDFILQIPVLSSTSEFVIWAYDDAEVTITRPDPADPTKTVAVAGPLSLAKYGRWETTGSPLSAGTLYYIKSRPPAANPSSSARIALQMNTGNGNASAPSSNGRDMGKEFLFKTHNWGGGAMAVFAYEDTTVTCVNTDSQAQLFSVDLTAGQTYYRGSTGRSPYHLTSTGNVAVWAGDLEGGGSIADMGDDITINQGNGGREFYLHSQTQGAHIFCAYDETVVTVTNVGTGVSNTYNRDRDGFVDIAAGQVLHIVASKPVMIETAGGNGFNDWGNALNPVFTLEESCAFPPVPKAGEDRTAVVGRPMTFDGSASLGTIISYQWDFNGDGTPDSTDAVASYTFNAPTPPGEPIAVTLTVSDSKGCQATDTVLITVREPIPFDLAVGPADISFVPAPPFASGTGVRITANIHNISDFGGTADVQFTATDGSVSLDLGTVTGVPLNAQSASLVFVDQNTAGLNGMFSYTASIIAANPAESTTGNNAATVTGVVIDGVAPSVSITGGPDAGSVVGSYVTFNWAGSDNFTPADNLQFSYSFDGGAYSAYSTAKSVSRSLSEGAHTFSVRAKDQAGLVSAPAERSFTVGLVSFSLTKSVDDDTPARSQLVTYTIGYTNNGTYPATGVKITDAIPPNTTYFAGSTKLNGVVVADPAGSSAISRGVDLGTVPAGASGNVTFQVTVANVSNGTQITNTAYASGGNLSGQAQSNTVTATVDTPDAAKPDTTITSGPGEGAKLCDGSASFSFTGSDDTTHVTQLQYQWRLDGGTWSAFDAATSKAFTGLKHGAHTFEVAARDLYGNIDETPALRNFHVDLNAPIISGVGATAGQLDVTITWTTDEPTTSQVDYGATASYGSSSPLYGSYVTSHSVTITGLTPSTPYHFRVRSKDSCGREALSPDQSFSTLADDGSPQTSITSGPSEGGRSCSSSVSICWSGSDNATPVSQLNYSWKMDEGIWSAADAETCHQFTGLSAGSHTFSVRAHDGSGNIDPTPATRTFVVSLLPPVITNVVASPQPAQATITWTTDQPATSQVEYGTTTAYASSTQPITSLRTSHSVSITGLAPDTTYNYRVISKDACERDSASENRTFRTPPDQDVPNTWFTSGPVEGGKSCDTDPQFCWTGSDNATPPAQLQFSYKLDSGEWSAWTSETCRQFTALAEGAHVLSVKAKDTSGNEDATPAVRNFKVDTVAPTASNIVGSPRTTSMIISWITSEPCTSQVEYGADETYGSATYVDTTPKTAHKLTVTGLSPLTTYHYRIVSSDGCQTVYGPDKTVTTAEIRPPNLLPQALSAPVSVTARQSMQLTWTVKNQAFGDAFGDWKDGIYLSEDEQYDEGDRLVYEFDLRGGLEAPFSYTQTQNAEFPIVAPGVYYLILKTDSKDVLAETNEADNILVQPVSVTLAQPLIAAPNPVPLNLNPTVSVSGQVDLSNLNTTDLTGMTASVAGASANVQVQITGLPSTLPKLSNVKVGYTVLATDESVLQNSPTIQFGSTEGATADVSLNLNIIPRQPKLISNPGYLQTGMLRGRQTIVECQVTNQGGVPATGLQVQLPPASWLTLSSPQNLGTLAPGESATVSLALTPPADLQLGPYNGSIVVSGNNGGVNIGFQFRAISDGVGDIKVFCNDEFTYYADGSPRVNNATIVLTDAVSGAKVFEEISDTTGILLKEGITEGYYNLEVRAEKHGTFRQPVQIEAGKVKEVVAFMPRQLVTYTWTVEPVEIQDRYKISIEAVFETHVPAPVVTVDPPYVLVPVMEGLTTVVNFTVTNHGLIAALGTQINFGTSDEFYIIPLIKDIGTLAAQSSTVVPVLFRRKVDGWPADVPQVAMSTGAAMATLQQSAVQAAEAGNVKVAGDGWSEPCDVSVKGEVIYYYVCDGNQWRRESIDTTLFNIAKAIWDAVECGFAVAACVSGVVDGIGLVECPDAIRCLFKYACEGLSALTGAPCCICKMTEAILGDTGALPDAAQCIPLPAPGPSSPGSGSLPGGGGWGPGYWGTPYVSPWGFNQGGSPCGPLPSGGSSESVTAGKTDETVVGPAKLPEDNGDAVIRKYGGKVIRTRVNVF